MKTKMSASIKTRGVTLKDLVTRKNPKGGMNTLPPDKCPMKIVPEIDIPMSQQHFK
jgi:hypothetical protein